MTNITSPTSAADRATTAWERHEEILALKGLIEHTFLELGGKLYEFHHAENWRDLNYVSFNEYLADPMVNIGRRTAYRCIRVYETYILQLSCDTVALLEAGVSKLDLMATAVTPGDVGEWLDKARTLSRSDLRVELDRPAPFSEDGHKAQASRVEPITDDEAYSSAKAELALGEPKPEHATLKALIDTFESGIQRGMDEAHELISSLPEASTTADLVTCPECGVSFTIDENIK
jgi:hypothetical protein